MTVDASIYTATWFIVPHYIVNLPDMTMGFLKVYETIFQFWNHKRICFLSDIALMQRTGLKHSQLYEAFAYFEKHNCLIRRKKNGKRYLIQPEQSIEHICSENIPTSAAPEVGSIKEQKKLCKNSTDFRSSGSSTSGGAEHNKKKEKTPKNKNTARERAPIFSENPVSGSDPIPPGKIFDVDDPGYKETYFSSEPIPESAPEPVSKPLKATKTPLPAIIEANPYNIPVDLIEQWLIVRKAKRAPLTPIAWQRLNKELAKCEDPIDAFEEMVSRGWIALKSEWLKPKEQTRKKELDFNSHGWLTDPKNRSILCS